LPDLFGIAPTFEHSWAWKVGVVILQSILVKNRSVTRCAAIELSMPVVSYDYQILVGDRFPRPICEIKLYGSKRAVPQRVLVDSGAEYTIFHESVAEDLGIELANGQRMPVQYGGSTAFGTLVDTVIEVGGCRFRVDAIYVERLDFPYGLLGRRCVFSRFNEVVFLEKLKTPRVEFRS
jgi:hypothetical protein